MTSPRNTVTKYRNKRTDGYASKREAKRAWELDLLERSGKISDLRKQVRYELIPKQDGERAVHYIADFRYRQHHAPGSLSFTLVVEDVKGMKTPEYIIKRKLMLWRHGIKIREV